jgi:phospholipid/cholesterol/gamma-HCH transport system substrate-binding protein
MKADSTASALRVGLFAAVTGVLLVLALLLFTGLELRNSRVRYTIVFEDSVFGLERGARVFLHGIPVGSVADLEVPTDDPSVARVVIEVDSGTPVTSGTTAVLRYAGITGQKVIDLRNSSTPAPRLAPGGRIAARASTLDRLGDDAERLVDETTRMIARVSTLAESARVVVDNLANVTGPGEAGALMTEARRTAASLSAASAKLGSVIHKSGRTIEEVIAEYGKVATRAAALLDSPNVRGTIADLRSASRSLKELARDLRQRPSRLIIPQPVPERRLP